MNYYPFIFHFGLDLVFELGSASINLIHKTFMDKFPSAEFHKNLEGFYCFVRLFAKDKAEIDSLTSIIIETCNQSKNYNAVCELIKQNSNLIVDVLKFKWDLDVI